MSEYQKQMLRWLKSIGHTHVTIHDSSGNRLIPIDDLL